MATIILKTCNDLIEANLIKGVLESNDIQCFLTNENFSNLMPHYNGMMGSGVQIIVEEGDLDAAMRLIKTKEEDKFQCPVCGSTDIKFSFGDNKFKKILIVILSLLVAVPFGNIKRAYYCRACRTEFEKDLYAK